MTRREAKRTVCSIAAAVFYRGGDLPGALYEAAGDSDADLARLEAAALELVDELERRARPAETPCQS